MDMLDQGDIDALLASADDPASADVDGSSDRGASSRPRAQLPERYRLSATKAQIKRLKPVSVPVIVRLASRKMKVEKVMELTAGSIIEFDRAADSDLDLIVNDVPVGTGSAVKCGENFGLRVIRIEPFKQRLLSLGLLR